MLFRGCRFSSLSIDQKAQGDRQKKCRSVKDIFHSMMLRFFTVASHLSSGCGVSSSLISSFLHQNFLFYYLCKISKRLGHGCREVLYSLHYGPKSPPLKHNYPSPPQPPKIHGKDLMQNFLEMPIIL